MTKGFVTIATGSENYYRIAANLLASYRYFTKDPYPFAIICDRENKYTDLFDDVVIMNDPAPTRSYMDKVYLPVYAPYDETIFIDSDVLAVLGDSPSVEDMSCHLIEDCLITDFIILSVAVRVILNECAKGIQQLISRGRNTLAQSIQPGLVDEPCTVQTGAVIGHLGNTVHLAIGLDNGFPGSGVGIQTSLVNRHVLKQIIDRDQDSLI